MADEMSIYSGAFFRPTSKFQNISIGNFKTS